MADNILLKVEHLTIDVKHEKGVTRLLHDISFEIKKGETLGIVGESGSGKSITSLSILRLLQDDKSIVTSGSITLFNDKEEEILSADKKELRALRGKVISMIFQEPMTALNPVLSCGEQIKEAILAHENISGSDAQMKVIELLKKVQISEPEQKYHSYPHQLSGGQKQRIMIAMAIANKPSLLIADEPTTALDVTVQAEILALLKSLMQEYGMAMIFISHDLGIVGDITDRLCVMYKGKIVEEGVTKQLLKHPQHPYTQALLACRPVNNMNAERLPVIKDFMGDGIAPYHPVIKEKKEPENEVLVKVEKLCKFYPKKGGLFTSNNEIFKAVDNVSFEIKKGETLGLVGESGCGKTTLSRCLLMLVKPTSGNILYKGNDIVSYNAGQLRKLRKQVQIIFQDPYSSLNPRITIGDAIAEPIKVHHIFPKQKDRENKVMQLLNKVGLSNEYYYRYPHELSGGQRQRICIARALAVEPEFIICDESVSALDVSVQAQVLNLLNDLKDEMGLTYLFISHDLSVVRYMSDRIMVMRSGIIEETGTPDEIFFHSKSLYTQKLLNAIPGKELLLS
jgi:peptide/nickel transport system ATP-binding protein